MLKSVISPSATKRHMVNCVLKDISPKKLLSVITDVDSYSQFLPLCKHSKIVRQSPCGSQFDATLRVGMIEGIMEEEYVSRVKVDSDLMTVEAKSIKSISGWLDGLSSRWKLKPIVINNNDQIEDNQELDNPQKLPKIGTEINFELEMCVSDPIISATLDHVLKEVAKRQVKAFERRCLDLQ
jgi:ribosome-associated toxin RatA of RatAB toxin-antitoxin module